MTWECWTCTTAEQLTARKRNKCAAPERIPALGSDTKGVTMILVFFSCRAIPWGFRPNCRSAALARPDLLALTALVGAHPRTRDPHGFETTKEFPLLVRLNKTGKLCIHNSSIEVSLSRMLSSYTSWSQKKGDTSLVYKVTYPTHRRETGSTFNLTPRAQI